MKTRSINHLQLSVILSVMAFSVTLSFPDYFYYLPFTSGVTFLSILQFFMIVGWILLIALPPLFLASEYKWSRSKYAMFMFSVSLWTLSTFLIKVNTFVSFGVVNVRYLTTYPVMIFFEFVIPAIYLYIGFKYYKPAVRARQQRVRSRPRFDDETVEGDDLYSQSPINRERFDDQK